MTTEVLERAETGTAPEPLLSLRGVEKSFGAVHVLCNNAGIMDRLGTIEETTIEEWDRLIAVHMTGPFLLTKRVIPGMVERGGGVIVNTASIGGLRGGRAGPAYTASKFGIIGLTKNIAATMSNKGIRCNAICPGRINTDLGDGIDITESGIERMDRDRDMPPVAEPREIAAMAVMLAEDDASYVNGAALVVDGGWIAY